MGQVVAYLSSPMRMPILAYFIFIGTTLFLLLNVSSYALPDVGQPIKTSQLVGLPPKFEPRPDAEPPLTSTSNFGTPMASADTKLPDAISAKDTGTLKRQNVHLTKQRQPPNKNHRSASREHRGAARVAAVYSHDVMMGIH